MHHVDVTLESVRVGEALVALLAHVGTEFQVDHVDVALEN